MIKTKEAISINWEEVEILKEVFNTRLRIQDIIKRQGSLYTGEIPSPVLFEVDRHHQYSNFVYCSGNSDEKHKVILMAKLKECPMDFARQRRLVTKSFEGKLYEIRGFDINVNTVYCEREEGETEGEETTEGWRIDENGVVFRRQLIQHIDGSILDNILYPLSIQGSEAQL